MIRTFLRDDEPGAEGGGTEDGGQQDSGADDMIPRGEFEQLRKRFDAMAANKRRLEDERASEAARKSEAAKALEQKALEDAREYEKLKAQLQADAAQAQRERDAVKAEYEARYLALKDGVVNDRVVNLFLSELQACETSEERALKWSEIKADPENAIFFAPAQAASSATPQQPAPPGNAAAGRAAASDSLDSRLKSTDKKIKEAANKELLAKQLSGELPV